MPGPPSGPPGIFAPRVLGRSLAIFLPAALLTGGVVLALYYLDRANEHALYEQAGAHLVDLHAEIISRELKSVESDLLYLADQAVLRSFLADGATRHDLEEEYVLFCRQRGVYDQIRYLDATGQERLRVNHNDGRPEAVAEGELQPKGGRYYFTRALPLGRGEVFVSPLDLNVEHEQIERPYKPVIRFATPVLDGRGVKRGVLVLNYLGAVLFRKLAEVSAGFPGSAWLLNGDGFFLRGPAPVDEWGFMLGHDRTFAASYPDEWAGLAHCARGQLQTARGLFTSRVLPTPEGGVVVVSHVPPDVLDGRADLLLRRLLLLDGVVLLLLLVLAWYLGHAGVLRRDHERRLAESEARLRTLSARLLDAQEAERRSLSRDLHDELGQVVTAVTLDLQRAAAAADRDKKDDLIGRALNGAGHVLDRIHEISTRLRPTLLDDLGLRDAVQSFLAEYERRTGVGARARLRFERPNVPAVVSENVYRILQEALTNVAKHARATEVAVDLRVTADEVALAVRDDGAGFDAAVLDGKRLGLLGMRERAELLEGTFTVQSEPGRGTEVRVTLPIRAVASG
jgi:signal transduction histidine kinase